MNKSNKTIATVIAVLIIGFGGVFVYNSSQVEKNENTDSSVQIVEQEDVEESPVEVAPVEIVISEDGKTVSYTGQTGKTALEVLKEGTEVSLQTSDYGDFVTGINGVEADASSEYWSFYVNGEYANEGAGTYQTTDGEQIEWKLEQL